jgi:hypothetical protein
MVVSQINTLTSKERRELVAEFNQIRVKQQFNHKYSSFERMFDACLLLMIVNDIANGP